ncbi:alkaline phosphatase [Clostridia bacterium]|nr:alkaline phosphatase [Clostridia bacterium]
MRKLLKTLALVMAIVFAASSFAFPLTAVAEAAPSITVFPVNRATILAGAVVDFKVEVNNVGGSVDSFNVTINGVEASDYLGQDYAEAATTQDGVYRLWSAVSFTQTGSVEVKVSAAGLEKTVVYDVLQAQEKQAKNVILMIGDGLAQQTRTAARIVSKNLTEGKYNGFLNMDVMDVATIVTTSGLNSLVTDSANSASAYATGHKTSNNAMGVYTFNPNDADQVAPKVENIIELAKRAGMATGIVSTSEITDATPAAMFVHVPQRSKMQSIVDQMLLDGQRPDVILGGGAAWFWPQSTTGSKRTDDRDAIAEFESLGYSIVGSATELSALDAGTTQMLGLFNSGNMSPYIDKFIEQSDDVLKSYDDQPALFDMTQTAIDALSQNENGFFLMVEGALIDKQEHAMDWERAVWDTIEFDKAVGVAKDFADQNDDTMVIVVADHSHSISVYGTLDNSKSGANKIQLYENAGYPTYTDSDGDGFPDEIVSDVTLLIGWGNHPAYYEDYSYHAVPSAPATVVDGIAVPNAQGRIANNPTLMPSNLTPDQSQEVHSADDVTLVAYGAGSEYFTSTITDNTQVFFAMINALGLDPTSFGK